MNQNIKLLNRQVDYIEYLTSKPKGTIFFVTGFGGTREDFDVVREKYPEYNFYSLSFPGFVQTPALDISDYDVRFYAKLTFEFIKEKNLNNLILIGLSLGGALATFLYNLAPNKFQKVLLIAPVNWTSQNIRHYLEPLFFPKSLEDWIVLAKQIYYKVEENKLSDKEFMDNKKVWINKVNQNDLFAQGQRKLAEGVYGQEILIELDKATSKLPENNTWLVFGEYDKIISQPGIVNYFQSKLPKIKIAVISNSDHVPYNNNLEEFLKIFNLFLKTKPKK